jgi:Mor family transcriptional regulator
MNKKSQSARRTADFLASLYLTSKQALIDHKIPAEQAEVIALEFCRKICETWVGQNVYIPSWIRSGLSDRDMQMWNDFTGDNHDDLVTKYKVSIQYVYRIIAFMRQQETAKRQNSLNF